MTQKIVLKNLQKPKQADLTEDVGWLCDSFGFSDGRDTEKTASRIVQALLREVANDGSTSTEDIASELKIQAQRVNYHIRAIINSGFVYRKKKLIFLRQASVKAAVEEMRKDANRIFDEMSVIAGEIDNALGLENR